MKYTLSIVIMAIITYFIRMLPLAIFKKQIENKWLKSFLKYIPYTVLSAMTFPAILYSTDNTSSAALGLIVGIIFAYFNRGLMLTAFAAVLTACISSFIL